VDIRIGVTYTAKELDIELPDDSDHEALKSSIEKAIADGSVLWITDRKGRAIGVPSDKIAYIDIGSPDATHRIGFSS
jgi:hypothetical protein